MTEWSNLRKSTILGPVKYGKAQKYFLVWSLSMLKTGGKWKIPHLCSLGYWSLPYQVDWNSNIHLILPLEGFQIYDHFSSNHLQQSYPIFRGDACWLSTCICNPKHIVMTQRCISDLLRGWIKTLQVYRIVDLGDKKFSTIYPTNLQTKGPTLWPRTIASVYAPYRPQFSLYLFSKADVNTKPYLCHMRTTALPVLFQQSWCELWTLSVPHDHSSPCTVPAMLVSTLNPICVTWWPQLSLFSATKVRTMKPLYVTWGPQLSLHCFSKADVNTEASLCHMMTTVLPVLFQQCWYQH